MHTIDTQEQAAALAEKLSDLSKTKAGRLTLQVLQNHMAGEHRHTFGRSSRL